MKVCLFVAFLSILFSAGVSSIGFAESSPRIESVQADFVQEKSLPILARPLLSKGRFVFRAPGSLRWEYFSPLPSVLLMDNGQVRKFIGRNGEFVEEHGMGLNAMQIVLQEITGWLDGKIEDTETFLAEKIADDTIILTPRSVTLQKIISRIELKLLGHDGLMESVTLYEGADSFTRMFFSNSILNKKIAAERFAKP